MSREYTRSPELALVYEKEGAAIGVLSQTPWQALLVASDRNSTSNQLEPSSVSLCNRRCGMNFGHSSGGTHAPQGPGRAGSAQPLAASFSASALSRCTGEMPPLRETPVLVLTHTQPRGSLLFGS